MSTTTTDQQAQWCPSNTVEEFTYSWKIRRFDRISATAKRYDYIESPTFSSSNNSFVWSLKLYPRGSAEEATTSSASPGGDSDIPSEDSSKDMIFYLILEENYSTSRPIVSARFHISVIHEGASYRQSGYDDYVQFNPGQGWRIVWRRDVFDLDGYVNNDGTLTIACDVAIKLSENKTKFGINSFLLQSDETKSKMGEIYGKMLEDELFTDVLLSVKGREFPAHRAILAAQSPVFRQMFDQNKESIHNRVIIVDISAEVVREMLRFLYTDKVPDKLKDMAPDLLAAACKYKLDRLKSMCSEMMSRDVNIDTAARYLMMAHVYGAPALETNAVQFIAAHPSQVMQSSGWQLLSAYPKLLSDLCLVLAKNDKERQRNTRRNVKNKK